MLIVMNVSKLLRLPMLILHALYTDCHLVLAHYIKFLEVHASDCAWCIVKSIVALLLWHHGGILRHRLARFFAGGRGLVYDFLLLFDSSWRWDGWLEFWCLQRQFIKLVLARMIVMNRDVFVVDHILMVLRVIFLASSKSYEKLRVVINVIWRLRIVNRQFQSSSWRCRREDCLHEDLDSLMPEAAIIKWWHRGTL